MEILELNVDVSSAPDFRIDARPVAAGDPSSIKEES